MAPAKKLQPASAPEHASVTAPSVPVAFHIDGPMLDAWRRVAPLVGPADPKTGKPLRSATDDDLPGIARQLLRDFLKQNDPW